MLSRLVPVLAAILLAATFVGPALGATAEIPEDLSSVALSYANALAERQAAFAYDLLSSETRSKVSPGKWQSALAKTTAARTPPATTLLRSLAAASDQAPLGDILIRPDRLEEALVELSGSVEVTQQLVLVRESVGWRVDLDASDQLNARAAAQTFLDALREEAASSAGRGSPGGPTPSGMSVLRALLGPQAADYQVVAWKVEGDGAEVTLAAQVPVALVLRGVRAGPGWTIDLNRPLLPVEADSGDPLKQATAVSDEAACQENLQQLVRAIEMYTEAFDGMLPDPDRWLDLVRPYLPETARLNCPAEAEPGVGYAMNRNLKGWQRGEVANPALVPMLYESTLRTANPAGIRDGWPVPSRHPGGNLLAFVDGSIRSMTVAPSFSVSKVNPASRGATVIPPGSRGRRPIP